MSFGVPWALCFLLFVPPVWLYLAFVRRRPTLVVPSVRPFRGGGGNGRFRNPDAAEYLFLAALALLALALARPRSGSERVIARSKGVDMIFALDMSGSMLACDPTPDLKSGGAIVAAIRSGSLKNRFETAKRELDRFAAGRHGDRIGLIGFADFACRFVPPTTDRALLTERLKSLAPRQIGDGTNLAAPIVSAVNRLKSSDSPRRVLILFTDGADNVGYRVTPEQAAALAKECRVVIYTVGIGGGNAVMAGRFGEVRRYPGQFDEALLRRIAAAADGEYFHAGDAEGMRKVMARIDALERTEKNTERFVEYREYAPFLALAALALMLLGTVLGNTWKLRFP